MQDEHWRMIAGLSPQKPRYGSYIPRKEVIYAIVESELAISLFLAFAKVGPHPKF